MSLSDQPRIPDISAAPSPPYSVAALYHFTRMADCDALRQRLEDVCAAHDIRGLLLLAAEGINGTVAGSAGAIDALLAEIRALPGCAALEVKFSEADDMPFLRMNVRVKAEIVTMGLPDIDPLRDAGAYVAPEDWNALISDPDTIVIDTRNDYEVAIGSFVGAIDPKTASFREFPQWFRDQRESLLGQGRTPKVAMFCTGGIRCEKSTAFLKAEGVENVFHLQGGILKYLETVPAEDSLWQGECFVFDQRVSVGHGLVQGSYGQCHACRRPLSPEDQQSPLFQKGVSCPHCYHERTTEQRRAYAERQYQLELAAKRGVKHLG